MYNHVFDSGVSDGRCKCGRKANDPVHVLHMADSPSAPPLCVDRHCQKSEVYHFVGQFGCSVAASRPREEEATAGDELLKEADWDAMHRAFLDATRGRENWYLEPEKVSVVFRLILLASGLASALRESRAREANQRASIQDYHGDLEAAEAEAQDLRVLCQRLSERAEAAERERETWQKLLQEWKAEAWARLAERDEAREELEAATSRIAQLEASLALSEDKVKALRQEIEALPTYERRVIDSVVEGPNGWVSHHYVKTVELSAVLSLLSPPTPTTANPAASLTQQGDQEKP